MIVKCITNFDFQNLQAVTVMFDLEIFDYETSERGSLFRVS